MVIIISNNAHSEKRKKRGKKKPMGENRALKRSLVEQTKIGM
jgi:hypothetical protein